MRPPCQRPIDRRVNVANPSAVRKLLNRREVVTLLDTEVGAKHWEIGRRIAAAMVAMAPLRRSASGILLMHIVYIPARSAHAARLARKL
jgi:hypothetical protein